MSLEKYLQYVAPRVGVTIPVSWGSERKVAYFRLENNLPLEVATAQDLKDAMETLMAIVDDFSKKHVPAKVEKAIRTMNCNICAQNGFPNEKVKWPAIYSPNNKPINLDDSPHVHKQRPAQ